MFKPGQSGNANGRPKGSKNKRIMVLEELQAISPNLSPVRMQIEVYQLAKAAGDFSTMSKVADSLMKYSYPLPAAIDDNGDTVAPIEVVFVSADKKTVETV